MFSFNFLAGSKVFEKLFEGSGDLWVNGDDIYTIPEDNNAIEKFLDVLYYKTGIDWFPGSCSFELGLKLLKFGLKYEADDFISTLSQLLFIPKIQKDDSSQHDAANEWMNEEDLWNLHTFLVTVEDQCGSVEKEFPQGLVQLKSVIVKTYRR